MMENNSLLSMLGPEFQDTACEENINFESAYEIGLHTSTLCFKHDIPLYKVIEVLRSFMPPEKHDANCVHSTHDVDCVLHTEVGENEDLAPNSDPDTARRGCKRLRKEMESECDILLIIKAEIQGASQDDLSSLWRDVDIFALSEIGVEDAKSRLLAVGPSNRRRLSAAKAAEIGALLSAASRTKGKVIRDSPAFCEAASLIGLCKTQAWVRVQFFRLCTKYPFMGLWHSFSLDKFSKYQAKLRQKLADKEIVPSHPS